MESRRKYILCWKHCQIKTLAEARDIMRDDSVVYCAWKDTKSIVVLSTEHVGHSEYTVKRNAKDSTGKFVKKDVPIPSPVYFYNKQMGGVDKSDQLIHYYNVLQQTKKYWKTLFLILLTLLV